MSEFKNKVVLITGAAGGIGLATAQAFAEEGAKVILVDINRDAVQHHAEEICAAGGLASSISANIKNFSDCEAMVSHAVETFGGLHIACNNAGIPCSLTANFEDYDIDEWNHVMSVNLNGTFYSMKAEVPALKKSGGTAIVNTASIRSFTAAAGVASYISSKHAVAGLTKAAAMDLIKRGIRVNAVCPGFTETPMLAHRITTPKARENMDAIAPIGRIATPNEIAQAVLFLASKKASYIVGALMRVDGGVTIP